MNKFKDWARWLRPDVEHHDAQEIADYLESLATLADGAPNGEPLQFYQNSISFVTKANRDYYQAKCAVLTGEKSKAIELAKQHLDAQVKEATEVLRLQRGLAAAQQKIAELEKIERSYKCLSDVDKRLSHLKDGICKYKESPESCYRIRCQLGKKCVDDDLSFRDQPKPVMAPLQFEALWTAWEAYSDSIEEHNGELAARKLRAKEYARKALCGE